MNPAMTEAPSPGTRLWVLTNTRTRLFEELPKVPKPIEVLAIHVAVVWTKVTLYNAQWWVGTGTGTIYEPHELYASVEAAKAAAMQSEQTEANPHPSARGSGPDGPLL